MAYTPGWNPDRQSRVARLASDQGHLDGPLPLLSAGSPPAVTQFDWQNPSFAARDRQSRAAILASDFSQVHGFSAATFPVAVATQPPGGQSTVLPPRAVARARDYSIAAAFPLELIGDDTSNVGAQSVAMPPRGLQRAFDYSITASFPPTLIGQDATLVGVQITDLPARGSLRARDYSVTQSLALNLLIPVGAQVTDLSPRAALRARDYSLTASFTLELIGQDATLVGTQLTGPAPAGPRRASTLSETGVNQTVLLTAAPPVIPCGQSTGATELPPRAALRARDYSLAASYPLELVNKDQFFGAAGEAQALDWQNPRGPLRLRDYGWTVGYMPVVPVGQSTTATELAPRAATRARDYSIGESFLLELNGQDHFFSANGIGPVYDWTNPSRGPVRSFSVYDPGQNAALYLQAGQAASIPPGQQSTDLSPRAAQRAKEYGQQSWYPLELIGKDNLPPGRSTIVTEGPPRGPLRARDYSIVASFPLELIGQDQFFGRPGEVPTYDWQLPPTGPLRARDYSFMYAMPLGLQKPRAERYVIGAPQAKWEILPAGPSSRWRIGQPDQ